MHNLNRLTHLPASPVDMVGHKSLNLSGLHLPSKAHRSDRLSELPLLYPYLLSSVLGWMNIIKK